MLNSQLWDEIRGWLQLPVSQEREPQVYQTNILSVLAKLPTLKEVVFMDRRPKICLIKMRKFGLWCQTKVGQDCGNLSYKCKWKDRGKLETVLGRSKPRKVP